MNSICDCVNDVIMMKQQMLQSGGLLIVQDVHTQR